MSWAVDDACELKVGGRWFKTTVHELDVAGHPRVRNPQTGKLVRVGPGKLRKPTASVVVRRTVGAEDDAAELAPVGPAGLLSSFSYTPNPPAVLVPQPKPSTPRSAGFLEHLRCRACDHCGAPPAERPGALRPARHGAQGLRLLGLLALS